MSESVEVETTAHVPAKRSRKVEIEAAAPVAMDEATALVALIERAAKDPSVDLDKMERLFRLHEAALDRRSKTAFAEALSAMQAQLPTVVALGRITGEDKDKNKITRSKYAKWEDVNEAIRPVLCEHGFALSFRITQPTPDRVAVTAVLTHRGGHSEETTLHLPNDPSGGKNNVQAWGSSVSYGKRYTSFALLNIAARGEDDDGKAADKPAEFITDAQVAELEKLIADTKSDKEKFLRLGNVTALADIPAANFDKARGLLTAKLKAMGAAS